VSSFTKVLLYQRHRDPGFYEITRAFKFYLRAPGLGEFVEVPQGFKTNFMTAPRWTELFYSNDDDTVRAASTVHDGLVGEWSAPLPIVGPKGERFADWWEAASIYRLALKVKGTSRFWRWFFYVNVMAYGGLKKVSREFSRLIDRIK